MSHTLHRALAACLAATFLATVHGSAAAQTRAGASPLRGVPAVPAPDGPVVLYTAEQPRIRVVPVVTGLDHPWGMAFRQNGDILVTERDRGALRVIRNGQLLDEDVPGVPEVYDSVRLAGLMDVTVHPEDDTLVYLTYSQERERDGRRGATVALARGRLDAGAGALTEVRDIFVADGWGGGIAASRLQWGPDGTLYMSVGGAFQFAQTGHYAQDGTTHFGKLLRLNDDGSAPDDNPFVDDPDHLPEIYSLGHRNQIGLAFHPDTGELWATEHGPQGGDEANIIRPGANYGWPIASYSRQYSGLPVTDTPWLPEFTGPEVIWWPSIGPSGLTFYDGEHFPAWRGNLFVGSMTVGRMPNTGHLERIVFNRRGQEIRREWLLTELKQRVREVQQGPDGYLYVLTEEDDGVLLRIEPARAITEAPGSIVPAVRLAEARVPPLGEADWTAEQRAFVERYEADGHSPNVVRTLARVPALGDRVLPFNHYIATESTLSPRHRTILMLRAAWLTQSGNIWATHAGRAAEAGLTDDEVLGIAMGFDLSSERDPFEETLIGLADQLFRNAAVTDRTWDDLAARYGTEEMLDAVMTVGDTISAAILFNSLGIQPDAAATTLMPTEDVGYSVLAPDAEPPLAEPRVEPVEGDGLRVTRTFLRNPAMSAARNQNERYILEPERSRLTPHDRELVILRMGWNSGAVYEWAKHVGSVGRARDHGLDPVWIAQGRDQTGWNARELALIDAANEMFRDSMISDETWEDLAAEYDTHQLMSIAATADATGWSRWRSTPWACSRCRPTSASRCWRGTESGPDGTATIVGGARMRRMTRTERVLVYGAALAFAAGGAAGSAGAQGLGPGDAAPAFELPGSDGRTHRLEGTTAGRPSSWRGSPRRSPAAERPNASRCVHPATSLKSYDIAYFMVSVDDEATNRAFAESTEADFPLLSDPTRTTARAYGVLTSFGGSFGSLAQRWTFYIGPDGAYSRSTGA